MAIAYNMWYIDMSGKLPMRRRAGNAKVRYSAAYPTGRELGAKRIISQYRSTMLYS